MPTRCIVAGCSNTSKDGVSLHFFPRDPKLRKIWTQRVKITRGNWNGPTESSAVCGAHFTEEDYEDMGLYSSFNIKKTRRLKADAVPTIKSPPPSTSSKRTSTATRSVVEKKRKKEMLDELLAESAPATESCDPDEPQTSQQGQHVQILHDRREHIQGMESSEEDWNETVEDDPSSQALHDPDVPSGLVQEMELSQDDDDELHSILHRQEEVPQRLHQPTKRSIRTQTMKISKRATRVKCVGRTVRMKDSWMQTEEGLQDIVRPVTTSRGIMCKRDEEDSMDDSKKSSSSSSSSSPPSRGRRDPDYTPDSSDSSSEEESSPQKQTKKRSAQTPQFGRTCPPHLEPKYIVFESKLLELFRLCRSCGSENVAISTAVKGTYVKVSSECWSCQAADSWESQTWYHNRPAGNLILSAAILFLGGSPAKTLRILDSIRIQAISERTFFRHQDEFLHPVIERRWQLHQAALLSSLAGRPLTIGGDGRADSPGHSAKYGLYTAVELSANQIVDIQLVQSNEVKSSYHMELEGFKRMWNKLTGEGLTVKKMVTDRHRQLAKHIRETTPGIQHMYDVWHVAKGVQKKVMALSKKKDFEVISKWHQSIVNHIYWVAASTTDEEEEQRVARWTSLLNHMQNIHVGHGELFPTCLHGALDGKEKKKKWLKSGSAACEKLDDIISSPMLMKDIKKLSSGEQTSSLESFHSVVNQFAPKMKSYSYHGLMSRIQLAAMHFNENNAREQATTRTGEKRFKVHKPKYKQGKASARPIKEDATFTYVDDLMATIGQSTRESRLEGKRRAAPPPLSSKYTYPPKEELVQKHYSRFKKGQE
ncbi:uncharacterized protein [Diadema antillarum]|uniref:uncharacterized protein n=1 Tax=Diadema antillarum TaxID=105358 RepID=UPI003A89F0B0